MGKSSRFHCPHCKKRIADRDIYQYTAGRAGSVMTAKSLAANRRNAKKGGRPKGSKDSKPRIRRSVSLDDT